MGGSGGAGYANNHTAIPMEVLAHDRQSYSEAVRLIKLTQDEYGDLNIHKKKIQDLLRNHGSSIFTPNDKGKTIFHELASQPERNSWIFEVFGFDEGGCETLRTFVHPFQLEELLTKRWGKRKCCPIHMAVENGYVAYVRAMVNIIPTLAIERDGDKNTPLHYAAKSSMPEANECISLLLAKSSTNDPTNYLNDLGETPIHVLCKKVPRNENCNAKGKLEKLISFFKGSEVLKMLDNDGRTPLHILCSHEDQQEGADTFSTLQDLMKSLSRYEDVVNIRAGDKFKRSALHILAISEFPLLLKILVSRSHTDVVLTDELGRTAIHYAAHNALRSKSQQIVMQLCDWNCMKNNLASSFGLNIHDKLSEDDLQLVSDRFRKYLLWEKIKAFDSGDINSVFSNGSDASALTLACSSRSTRTVDHILRNLYEAKPDFSKWFDSVGEDEDPEVHSLEQVYKFTPGALEFLFDKSLSVNCEESNELRVIVETELSLITGLTRPVHKKRVISEMEFLGYAPTWPYDIQEKLLLHPLTQFALRAAWEKMLPLKIIWFLVNFTWLVSYWWLIPMEYSRDGAYAANVVIPAWILFILIIISFFEYLGRLKVCHLSDLMIWIQIVLTGVSVFRPVCGSLGYPITFVPKYEQICSAVGVLLTSFLLWRNLSIIYLNFGIHVEYLLQTLTKIAKALVCIMVIIIGFLKAFSQILPTHFSSPFRSFTKTLVMMTGEFEFDDLYKNDEDDGNSTEPRSLDLSIEESFKAGSSLVVFILFLVILPVAFYNLITGLVVEKIQNMESKLEMYCTRNLIRLTRYFQDSVISKLNWIGSYFEYFQSYLISYRRNSEGTILYETRIKWYIDKDVNPSFWTALKETFNCRRAMRVSRKWKDDANVYCGNYLPKCVKQKVFEMYERERE